MHTSSRVKDMQESITLKLNARAVELAEKGKTVFNLTAGQLPFRPMNEFVDLMRNELNFLKSFQYSPVVGFPDLRQKILKYVETSRGIDFSKVNESFDVVVSNGGKHAIANILGAMLDPGDEVIILSPYWISYPALIKFCRAVPIEVKSSVFDVFVPSLDDIKRAISAKTKAIIINSPNNPTGTHYSKEWMIEFGKLMLEHPDVNIISDEIYFELYYFDPKPFYFYQEFPELLKRTVIVDGISKTLASTGLRLGYCIAPKNLCKAIGILQGQTTSGANSLVQRALANFDFEKISEYLAPIKTHLRANSEIVREKFREKNLAQTWYQTLSAFYYIVDFSQSPVMNKFRTSKDDQTDYSEKICEVLLEEQGIAIVPGTDFGLANSARISLVLEKEAFKEAMERLVTFLAS